MLKIGEFSRITQVSIKTLRFYNQIGLLEPDHIDKFTGHRYYSLEQLPRVNLILALKAMGLALEQIQDVVAGDLTDQQLEMMLAIKKAELQQTLLDVNKQIMRLDTRIQFIRQEGQMPNYEVIVKSLTSQRVLSLRQILADGAQIEGLLHEIYVMLKTKGIESAGEWMTLYHHDGFRSEDLDVEIAVSIGDLDIASVTLDDERTMSVRVLEGYDTVATTIEQGQKDSWQGSYSALGKWMENHQYELVLPTREVYLTDENDRDGWMVEIQYPITKRISA